MWGRADEPAATAHHKFRGEYGDTYILIALVHFVIERHHKVLLWKLSMSLAGSAMTGDEWDAEHRAGVWTDLGGGGSGSGGSVSSLVVGR